MKNIVRVRVPALKPLPGELTPSAIRDAVLPVKIEAMRTAIAKCTELPELLNYKRTVDGLAAAARFEGRRFGHSDSMRLILGGRDSRNYGLNRAASALQDVPLGVFANLSDIERKIVRKKIVECQELLDAMEQRL